MTAVVQVKDDGGSNPGVGTQGELVTDQRGRVGRVWRMVECQGLTGSKEDLPVKHGKVKSF